MQNQLVPSDVIRPLPEYLPGAPIPPRQEEESEWISGEQLREYWRVIRKYRALIAACLVMCVIGGLLYAFTATPLYTAQSKIRIGSYDPVLLAANIEEMLLQQSKEQLYLDTQIQEIESLSVADRVLRDDRILESLRSRSRGWLSMLFNTSQPAQPEEELSAGYQHPVRYLEAYLKRLAVKPVRRTSLVLIEATSDSPTLAAYIANRHAEEYLRWVRDIRVRQQSQGLSFLQQQASELRTKLSDLEREMADYAEEHSIVAVNKDENIIVQKMARLNDALTETMTKRITADNQYEEARAALADGNTAFDDQSVQSMQAELAKLEAEASELSVKFTDSYPKMQQLRSQIDGLKTAIADHRASIVRGLKVKAKAVAEEEASMREELEQQKSRAFELSKKQVQYNILNREADSTRELLQNVLRQIKETSLSVESKASNVSIVDQAVKPAAPTFPRKKMIVLLSGLLGTGLGLSLAFLLRHLDNTLHSPEEVVAGLRVPNLGVVPLFEHEPLQLEAPPPPAVEQPDEGIEILPPQAIAPEPIVFFAKPQAIASEAYRTIRTAILLSQAGQPPRTLLVSSAQAGEGKTTLCINLAASLASSGGRVLLIDADLRRPSVWRYFDRPRESRGLVDVLTGQAGFDEACVYDDAKAITFIPAGRVPPNPAELLGSTQMAALLAEVSAKYDYVIIDSPPILPVTDSVLLSRIVDGVVLVVKGSGTPKPVVIDAKNRLQNIGARVLGVVLNAIDVTRNDYAYYNRYYYSYYQTEQRPSSRRGRAAVERVMEV